MEMLDPHTAAALPWRRSHGNAALMRGDFLTFGRATSALN